MTTKSIDWGFSELASGSGALKSDQALWRPKAELFMALNSYGIWRAEDLMDNEFLGNGTSFKVHACKSRKSSELVAVKRLIRTNSSNQNRLIKVLQKELQILSFEPLRETTTLVNIRGYEWKHNADLPSVVIEYANYGTLQKFLFNKGNFVDIGWNLCRSLCLDVAVALEVLHAHGIIHGDLKMENVLVYWHEAKYATAKVSDFGHSVFHLAADETASYIGTPIYNPPEVLRLANGDLFAHMSVEQLSKCDVWSFGLMVWCTINAGESYFQDQWLSQGRIYVDRLDFLINQPPNYLQLASSEFIRDFEALASAPASLKVVFADLLWKCLHSVSEERCTMRDASILLDSER
jgi:serine/threonine protein kinase